ncbi:MAG: flagellar biosynthesis protein FlhB [Henriciella sp.]|nr:flagellar biosynthesis protein FlhB [Henriciella sp.]
MAEEQDQSGEKEFDATDERLRQAREDGDVPMSKEANAAGLIIGIGLGIMVFLSISSKALSESFTSMFYHADRYAADIFNDQGSQTRKVMGDLMISLAPLFLVLAASVLLVLILQQGIAFSTKKVQPDMKKINPVENIKNKYGAKGLLDFLKDAAKMTFAGLIAAYFLIYFANEFYAGSAMGRGQLADFTLAQILKLILFFAAFQIALALLDVPLQRYLHANRLKMTREEVKKEMKQNEGDPHLKQQRRERGTQITRGDMLKNVETATVIMVNPEHYAVALKWDPEGDKAPICVAKGVDHLAAKIREVAQANHVPIYRDPPTARSLYRLVEIDEEIKQEHFAAVAAAIQYVDRVRQHLRPRNDSN